MTVDARAHAFLTAVLSSAGGPRIDATADTVDTPSRFAAALREMLGGYEQDPVKLLGKTFQTSYRGMVAVRDIAFSSLCAHHVLPFAGTVDVVYLPRDGVVVGLSKVPRAVRAISRRLQVQEQMTDDIANALDTALRPAGVYVRARAVHSCMRLRGVESHGEMVTASMRGVFHEAADARQEAIDHIRGAL